MSEHGASPGQMYPSDEVIDRFVSRLERLDPAGRAGLKRNAGHTLDEARDVYQIFFAILPFSVHGRAVEEDYFLVATLFPIGTRRDQMLAINPPKNLGASLGLVRQELVKQRRDPDRPLSLDRRVAALLNTDREQLPFRLRQLVRLLAAHDVAIDWRQLLRDVRRWNADRRRVQRIWADAYFRGAAPKADRDETTADADKALNTEEE